MFQTVITYLLVAIASVWLFWRLFVPRAWKRRLLPAKQSKKAGSCADGCATCPSNCPTMPSDGKKSTTAD